jgi:hypothetical protein
VSRPRVAKKSNPIAKVSLLWYNADPSAVAVQVDGFIFTSLFHSDQKLQAQLKSDKLLQAILKQLKQRVWDWLNRSPRCAAARLRRACDGPILAAPPVRAIQTSHIQRQNVKYARLERNLLEPQADKRYVKGRIHG